MPFAHARCELEKEKITKANREMKFKKFEESENFEIILKKDYCNLIDLSSTDLVKGPSNGISTTTIFRRHSLQMNHPADKQKARPSLLDALSKIVRTRRGSTRRDFVYCKIQSTMTPEKKISTCDPNDITLQENSDVETQCKRKLSKKPKRILQFSDGVMEEYSSEDEVDAPKNNKSVSQINTKNMNWLPWAWYQTTWVSSKMLDGCDYVGECLANFFGITAPKYQFEINEFYRLQALEKETYHQDIEMGGWKEQKKENFINNEILTNEHN